MVCSILLGEPEASHGTLCGLDGRDLRCRPRGHATRSFGQVRRTFDYADPASLVDCRQFISSPVPDVSAADGQAHLVRAHPGRGVSRDQQSVQASLTESGHAVDRFIARGDFRRLHYDRNPLEAECPVDNHRVVDRIRGTAVDQCQNGDQFSALPGDFIPGVGNLPSTRL